MKNTFTIGRILFALPFGIIGLNHFFMYDVFAGMVTSFIPGAGFSVILTGIALVAASISIISNKYIVLSCSLLASLLLIFIATIHIPNLFIKERSVFALIELLKDTGLAGGALMIVGTYKKSDK